MRQAMRIVDKVALAVMRRVHRRRRERELEDLLPGLEGYGYPIRETERHTAARRGGGGKVVRYRQGLRVAVAAVVVAAGLPAAYVAGATTATAAASEEADRAVIEEASAEYTATQMRESTALSTAVAAYSAEREVGGETVPEEVAMERLLDRGLTEAEASAELEGLAGLLLGKSHEEAAAIAMWEAEPPEGEVTRERIEDYEDASAETDEARVSWKRAWDESR